LRQKPFSRQRTICCNCLPRTRIYLIAVSPFSARLHGANANGFTATRSLFYLTQNPPVAPFVYNTCLAVITDKRRSFFWSTMPHRSTQCSSFSGVRVHFEGFRVSETLTVDKKSRMNELIQRGRDYNLITLFCRESW